MQYQQLPQLGNANTLGCELQFVHMNTLQVLADPIQSAISTNQKYYVIAEQCMVEAGHKGQLKGEVKAVRVLCSRNGKIPPQAFFFCTEIRHVLVRMVSRLQERLRGGPVDNCKSSTCQTRQSSFCMVPSVSVKCTYSGRPKLQDFGTNLFEECCSLTQVGAAHCPSNKLAPQAQLRPRAFSRVGHS